MKYKTNLLNLCFTAALLCLIFMAKGYGTGHAHTMAAKPAASESPWYYKTDTDQMTSAVSKKAYTYVTDGLRLKFPYEDAAGTLMIRKKEGKLSVMFNVTTGQIVSADDEHGKKVRVRFDSDPPEYYTVTGATNSQTTSIFLDDEEKFIKRLKTAKKLLIEVAFYDNPTQQIVFDTDGFIWE
jgi:hypothetical protein